ncbi:hypothetical protein CC79DRAFT_566778 [Sarocladium strictum]
MDCSSIVFLLVTQCPRLLCERSRTGGGTVGPVLDSILGLFVLEPGGLPFRGAPAAEAAMLCSGDGSLRLSVLVSNLDARWRYACAASSLWRRTLEQVRYYAGCGLEQVRHFSCWPSRCAGQSLSLLCAAAPQRPHLAFSLQCFAIWPNR